MADNRPRILLIGSPVTWVVASLLAYFLLGFEPATSALLGATRRAASRMLSSPPSESRANDSPAEKRKRRVGWVVAAGVGLTLALATKYLPSLGVHSLFDDLIAPAVESISATAPKTTDPSKADQSTGNGGDQHPGR